VRGAVIRDGRILLVREVSDGLWTVPGGWADVNESASACAVREVREESGFEARVVKLVGVWDSRRQGYRYRHPFCIYKLFFLCELLGGTPKPSIETSEVGFFALETLPALSRGRVNATQIARMFAHQHDPALPAEFD
jgi:ADP-ribose pyrophosphatase YjhB (NUDIX family)